MKKLSAIFVDMSSPLKKDKLRIIEVSLLIIIWFILFLSPIIIQSEKEVFRWEYIFSVWNRLIPFFILSLINHFLLVPFLFFNKRKYYYLISSFLTIVIFSLILVITHKKPGIINNEASRRLPPPRFEQIDNPPPRPRDRSQIPPLIERRNPPGPIGSLPPFVNSMIIAFLILASDTGLRTIFKWSKSEQEKEAIEKERVKSELAFLKHQVSPHFFMNTLNNIHALIEYQKDDAKEAVIRLSKMMRYLLYESETGPTTLEKEVEFITNYIELNKLRINENIDLQIELPSIIPDLLVYPLIFVTFIENAFKYGISNVEESFIHLKLWADDDSICFTLRNSNFFSPESISEHSGIGVENTRKRLDLLYGSNYKLEINDEFKIFSVKLKIPGYADKMPRNR